jgi:hypothetical protein
MRPFSINDGVTLFTRSIGTAKPMFCASGRIDVVMPTTSPHRLTNGPPEFPGLIDASVWIIGSLTDNDRPGSRRFKADTIPRDNVCSSPNGFPIANTSSPTTIRSESPKGAACSGFPAGGVMRIKAMSKSGSAPTSFAGRTERSSSVTMITWRPTTTCAFVTIRPEGSITTPDATTRSKRFSTSCDSGDIAAIETTAGDTRS